MYDVTESVHNILMLYWWVVHESHCQIPHNVVIGKRVQIYSPFLLTNRQRIIM